MLDFLLKLKITVVSLISFYQSYSVWAQVWSIIQTFQFKPAISNFYNHEKLVGVEVVWG